MLQPNTTEKEGKLFTGRTSIIAQLKDSISKKKTAALLAHSGYGRTALLKHFAAKEDAAYIDLRKLSISPESFAVDLITTLCFLNFAKDSSERNEYRTLEQIGRLKLGAACRSTIAAIENELQKIKPDQQLITTAAFGFAGQLAAEQKKESTVILNNFEELLKLNNFSGIKDILAAFFSTVGKDKNTQFIIASSALQVVKGLLRKHPADVMELTPLELSETRDLFNSIAGKSDDRITKETHELSAGIPLIVRRIALRFRGEKTGNVQKDIALIRYILVSDLTTTTSPSYFYCSKLFTASLNRARGESLLKTILKAVSQNKPLRLTETARLIYRSGPVTKSLLERLVEVDLITKTDSTFDFSNPVLKLWCSTMFSSIEFDDIPSEDELKKGGLL